MQEELEQQTVALVIKAGKLSAETFADAIHRITEKGLNLPKLTKDPHGKMKLSELVGKGIKTDKVEFKEEDLKFFHKIAAKYNIDYAVHSEPNTDADRTEKPNKYYVFFQVKDAKIIDSAFNEFLAKNEKRKESVQKKLEKKQEIVNKRKNKERDHEKNRNKELRR